MFMKIDKAVEKAKDLERVSEILDAGGFLCSAYLLLEKEEQPKKWNLAFYSKKRDEITSVEVEEEEVSIGVTDEPLRENTGKIELGKISIGTEEGIKKAKEVVDKDFNISYRKFLFSVKSEDERQVWRGVFVGKSLSIVTVSIDTETGEVLEKESKRIASGSSFGG